MYRKIIIAILFIRSIFIYANVACFETDEQNKDNTLIEESKRLLLNGDIARAAISFYEVQNQSYITPFQRAYAQEQFNSCIEMLRSDTDQTQQFGDMILLQKEDFKIQYLLQTYASILEFQGKVDDAVNVYRRIYNQWPGSPQKYMLARKLEYFGMWNEAFDLYQDLLNDQRYRSIVLRQILEGAKYSKNGEESVNQIIKAYYNDILYNYDLINTLVSVYISQNRFKDAIELAFEMVSRYPQSVDSVVYNFAPLYKEGKLNDNMIDSVLSARSEDGNKFMYAKILAASGYVNKALSKLDGFTSPNILEYKADLLYSSSMLEQAAEAYRSLVKNYPHRSDWFYRLAEISLKLGNHSMAVQYLQDYLNFSENKNFNSYFQAGKMLEQYGMNQDAERFYAEGKKYVRESSYAQIELIKYYIMEKNFSLAAKEIADSQKQPRITPSNIILSVKYMLASDDEFKKLTAELIKITESKEYIDISANEKANLFYCAHVFAEESGATDPAVEFMKKYYSLSSSKPEAENRMMDYIKKLEREKSFDNLNELLLIIPPASPYYPQALHKRARILISQGNAQACIDLLKSNLTVKDDFLIAQAFYELGEHKKAYDLLSAIPIKSSSVMALKGDIALCMEQFDTAIKNYSAINNSADELFAVSRYKIGLAYLFSQKYDDAHAVFDKLAVSDSYSKQTADSINLRKIIALISRDKNLIKQWSMAEFAFFKEDYETAINKYMDLIGTASSDVYIPDFYMRLHEIFLKSGNKQQALAQLDKIISEFPNCALASMAMRYSIRIQSELNPDGLNKEESYIKFLEKYPDTYDADIVRDELEKIRSQKPHETQM